MESVAERLNKFREERTAREKSRIEKLRELNLKKYNRNNEPQSTRKPPFEHSMSNRTLTSDSKPKFDAIKNNIGKCTSNSVRNKNNANVSSKRLTSVPRASSNPENKVNTKTFPKSCPLETIQKIIPTKTADIEHKRKTVLPDNKEKKDFIKSNKKISKPDTKAPVHYIKSENIIVRKSLAPMKHLTQNKLEKLKVAEVSRKSMLPSRISETKNHESVFDRLYKPKLVQKVEISEKDRLQKDPLFLKKVMKQGGLITNKRHTVFEPKQSKTAPVRRSISAVHFKRISKNELAKCFKKWSSIGEKLDEVHLNNINEDDSVKQDVVTSAIKNERKKVRLQTPGRNFNTPTSEELQSRLIKWLKSHGKSIDSYQHLQCFGIHHLPRKPIEPLYLPPEPADYDDENKENIALEHDSDNESFTDNMNGRMNNIDERTKWRSRVSYTSESPCLNKSLDRTLDSDELPLDDLLLGALNDLTELLREGFDWEQCARWLRALRERFPYAPSLAAYWECRAALEETRGDLPASVQCWEEAIAKGTQHSVVDANLDQLLGKFMQLNISPSSGRPERVNPKLVDIKNVFKSTIIRFAVQQAKLRQSNQQEKPTYLMTPVRRSARLSAHWSAKKTPLLCSSVKEAELADKQVLFVRNPKLCDTP